MSNLPATPAPTTVILCRHGESEWNVDRRIQGQSLDAGGLTPVGQAQARLLGQRLKAMHVEVLISSDLRRAVETAAIVGMDLGLRPDLDARWREADLGTWQGLHRDEARERWPEEWKKARREDLARGGGETFVEVQARVLAALRDLLAEHAGKTVAVITHGGPIYACLGAVLNYSFPEVYELLPANRNTNVTILRAEEGLIEPLVIMDSSHLQALDAEQAAAGNAEPPDPKAPMEA